jgi:hypothetical protein
MLNGYLIDQVQAKLQCLFTCLARFKTEYDVFAYLIDQAKTDYDGWLHDWPGSSQITMFFYLIGQVSDRV